MKNYIKLLNFEMNRIAKLLGILILFIFGIQMIGTIYLSTDYMNEANEMMLKDGYTADEVTQVIGQFSFVNVIFSVFFTGPIFIAIAFVLFYIFLVWYRDWFGKNTFAYRLLMLPTERVNIYLSKLTTIFLITLSFVSMQLILMPIEMQIIKWIVSEQFRVDLKIAEVFSYSIDTGVLYPPTFFEFALNYGIGIVCVAVIFTAILFERSYRFKGILFGIVYGIISGIIIISPVIFNKYLLNHYFYTDEIIILIIISTVIVLALSIAIAHYLLRNKIRI